MRFSLLLAASAAAAAAAPAALSDFTRLADTDVTPCAPPCVRVGGCGNYAPNPNGPCNVSWVAEQCSATFGCVAFNTNGWLKGCANASCGVSFESVGGTDTYVNTSSGGNAVPLPACGAVLPVDDVFYPSEEPSEAAAGAAAPAVLQTGPAPGGGGGGWALLAAAGGATANVSVGGAAAFGFELVALLGDGTAVLERSFARWGFIAFVRADAAGGGEVARLRKGVGTVSSGFAMPHYGYLASDPCQYYAQVYNNASDLIGQQILAETGGEATYEASIKYLPPQRDYASIGGIDPYNKFSVSPDGRIKIADSDIWTTSASRNETGPGKLVFDPADFLGALGAEWPATNFTFTKSALVGSHLRVVITAGFSYDSYFGFEQIAFAPASEPAASAYIRLGGFVDGARTGPVAYFNASSFAPTTPLAADAFYSALLAEQALWNATFASPATAYALPGREGARQVDMARGSLVASLSLYVGLTPNYGDGADYWSPQCDRGGSLPFQLIAVVQNLIDVNLQEMAAQRLGWWLDNCELRAQKCLGESKAETNLSPTFFPSRHFAQT